MKQVVRLIAVIACGVVLFGAVYAADSLPWEESTPALGQLDQLPSGLISAEKLQSLIKTGEALFSAKFTRLDGAGRPNATQAIIPTRPGRQARDAFSRTAGPDANACSSCHNDPVVGGAGDFVTNVFVSEGFANSQFDTINPQFSNERGTNHLFGAGLLELLAREMSAELAVKRHSALQRSRKLQKPQRAELSSKGVFFGAIVAFPDGLLDVSGIEGIDADLVVRPFSQKGVMTSLRQFTVNAMNHHHGMQATERFGSRWTGSEDFDQDQVAIELSAAAVSALVAWQAALPPPLAFKPEQENWQAAATMGARRFGEFGCVQCHIPALPLNSLGFQDPGPVDVAGTLHERSVQEPAVYALDSLSWATTLPRNEQGQVLVPLFGDLKRHAMTDKTQNALGNELLSQRFVDRTIFMTAELWGVASTAPYGHRNDFTTLDGIIRAHGGESRAASDQYIGASEEDRQAIIAYLKTLGIAQ